MSYVCIFFVGVMNLNLLVITIIIHFLRMCEDCILMLALGMKVQPSFSLTLKLCKKSSLKTSVIS